MNSLQKWLLMAVVTVAGIAGILLLVRGRRQSGKYEKGGETVDDGANETRKAIDESAAHVRDVLEKNDTPTS